MSRVAGELGLDVREVTVTSRDGARLHVEVYGEEGAPAVVLAHGWTCSIGFWAAQIRELARDFKVVAYDQRGHGRSPDSAAYAVEGLADDLEAVLSATLAPGEKAVIAGHSMGGMTVMAAAGRAAFVEHAAAVLLCSTGSSRLVAESLVVPLRAGRLRTRLTRSVLGAKAPLGPVTPVSKAVLKYATMGRGASPERVLQCARIVHACPKAARVGWSHVLAELELADGVRELDVPVAVVAGADDRLTPPVHARGIEAALRKSLGLTLLTGVGHMTPVEAPEVVSGKIRQLVREYVVEGAGPKADAGAQQKEEVA
ncbi:hydrolase [Streptomyces spiroverticillatus]|uniref:Hydrolase n=1 Tax=Streptomyces finlayi TaxID=67296 RepID=A0A919CBM2_9ACTN|nr:alpha/beta hydrolase [Streptomyces finlayi]GHA19431.1 hydrolase [Streptomyces spiroverticillatus]GHD02415.1 hydrolase [Streptomyces finlayi]